MIDIEPYVDIWKVETVAVSPEALVPWTYVTNGCHMSEIPNLPLPIK